MIVEFLEMVVMTTAAQLYIKVVITSDKPGTITLSPNPKTPGVSLFLIGTSARTSVPERLRDRPLSAVSVEVDCERKLNDLIIVETRLGAESMVHLLQVTWKGAGCPYIDLAKSWVPGDRQHSVQPLPRRGGGYCLRVVVGKGKSLVTYSTHSFGGEDPDEVKISPPDLLCQFSVGVRSLSQFKKGLEEADAVASASASAEGTSEITSSGDPQTDLLTATKRIRELEERLQSERERISLLKGQIEDLKKDGMPEVRSLVLNLNNIIYWVRKPWFYLHRMRNLRRICRELMGDSYFLARLKSFTQGG